MLLKELENDKNVREKVDREERRKKRRVKKRNKTFVNISKVLN